MAQRGRRTTLKVKSALKLVNAGKLVKRTQRSLQPWESRFGRCVNVAANTNGTDEAAWVPGWEGPPRARWDSFRWNFVMMNRTEKPSRAA